MTQSSFRCYTFGSRWAPSGWFSPCSKTASSCWASTISAITVFLLIVYLRRTYSAMRWMAIGVALAALFSVYPILFNVYLSFTNMGGGHLISKQQSIERLESEQYPSRRRGHVHVGRLPVG